MSVIKSVVRGEARTCATREEAEADAVAYLRWSHERLAAVEIVDGGRVVAWTIPALIPTRPQCFCPGDCNCRNPHRTTFCGCKAHPDA